MYDSCSFTRTCLLKNQHSRDAAETKAYRQPRLYNDFTLVKKVGLYANREIKQVRYCISLG